MSDIQNPTKFIHTSQGFDFSTLTGQTPTNSPVIDLNDTAVNLQIVDYLNSTGDGSGRAFLNGKIAQDPDEGFFYLTGNPDLTDTMTFTQPQDDLDAGKTISMPLTGDSTAGYSTRYDIQNKVIKPRGSGSYKTQEADSIIQSFADHGHNSYAYRPYLHPEHADYGHFASGEFIEPLTQGTGVYTTRMLDQWAHSIHGQSGRRNITYGNLDGRSTDKVYKADGVTIDEIATFYAQQNKKFGFSGSAANTDRSLTNRQAMYGQHYAFSMAIKLGSEIQTGEFVPFMMISRNGWSKWARTRAISDENRVGFATRLCGSTGTDINDADWYKHMIQYHFLTSDPMIDTKRNIKQCVMYVGKPIGGNVLGGQYEWVIWNAGYQDYMNRKFYISKQKSWNTTYTPTVERIPIDDSTGTFDASTWQPFFYHSVSSSSHTFMRNRYKIGLCKGFTGCWPYNTLWSSRMGMSMGAYSTGIQDLSPTNLLNTELYSGTGHSGMGGWKRHYNRNTIYGQQLNHDYMGWGANNGGYYVSFLTVPGKVQGIANINTQTFADNFHVPESAGDEDNRRSLTYFPERTVQYEAVGSNSEIANPSNSWEDIDFVLDGNMGTTTSGYAVGEENYIEIKTKRAPQDIDNQLNDSSVMKYMEIEVRNVAKKYMNPALKFKYSLWNYENELNPYRITSDIVLSPKGSAPENSKLVFNVNLADTYVTYADLNNARLRIWVE